MPANIFLSNLSGPVAQDRFSLSLALFQFFKIVDWVAALLCIFQLCLELHGFSLCILDWCCRCVSTSACSPCMTHNRILVVLAVDDRKIHLNFQHEFNNISKVIFVQDYCIQLSCKHCSCIIHVVSYLVIQLFVDCSIFASVNSKKPWDSSSSVKSDIVVWFVIHNIVWQPSLSNRLWHPSVNKNIGCLIQQQLLMFMWVSSLHFGQWGM